MPASTSSGWWMAMTGPSATTLSSLSVTTVAISIMTSESGLRPVISRSIQMRFSVLAIGVKVGCASFGESVYQRPCGLMNDTFEARVTATYGRHLLVRDPSGKELQARPFGRGLTVVCGDNVRCRLDPHHDEVHVVEVLPRRTALYRSNLRGVTEPVVANLSRL